MSCHYPFRLTIFATVAFALLAPAGVAPLHAQVAQPQVAQQMYVSETSSETTNLPGFYEGFISAFYVSLLTLRIKCYETIESQMVIRMPSEI